MSVNLNKPPPPNFTAFSISCLFFWPSLVGSDFAIILDLIYCNTFLIWFIVDEGEGSEGSEDTTTKKTEDSDDAVTHDASDL